MVSRARGHVSVQVVRLNVVTFIRLFLQRNPSERISAHDAAASDLFKELHYMRQEHRETETESQLLIINRRPLKRAEKEEEKAEDTKPEEPRRGPKMEWLWGLGEGLAAIENA